MVARCKLSVVFVENRINVVMIDTGVEAGTKRGGGARITVIR